MNDTASIVSKVWSFCHTLRDDGVSYGDYLEQLTNLMFPKMTDEYRRIYKKDVGIPAEYNWDSLKTSTNGRKPGQKTIPTADGANSPIKTSSPVTKPVWTSSGSETKAWQISTTSPIRMYLLKRSSKTLKQVSRVLSKSWSRSMGNSKVKGVQFAPLRKRLTSTVIKKRKNRIARA